MPPEITDNENMSTITFPSGREVRILYGIHIAEQSAPTNIDQLVAENDAVVLEAMADFDLKDFESTSDTKKLAASIIQGLESSPQYKDIIAEARRCRVPIILPEFYLDPDNAISSYMLLAGQAFGTLVIADLMRKRVKRTVDKEVPHPTRRKVLRVLAGAVEAWATLPLYTAACSLSFNTHANAAAPLARDAIRLTQALHPQLGSATIDGRNHIIANNTVTAMRQHNLQKVLLLVGGLHAGIEDIFASYAAGDAPDEIAGRIKTDNPPVILRLRVNPEGKWDLDVDLI